MGNEGAHLCNPIIIQSTHMQQFTAREQSDMKETYSTCNTLPPTRTFLLQQCWREGAREDEGGWRDEWETDRKEEEHLGRIGRRRERESVRAWERESSAWCLSRGLWCCSILWSELIITVDILNEFQIGFGFPVRLILLTGGFRTWRWKNGRHESGGCKLLELWNVCRQSVWSVKEKTPRKKYTYRT